MDSGSIAWMLTCSALVLFMTPGLAFFYGGLVRSKNVISTLMYSFISLGIASLIWVLWGYSLAFGDGGNAFIGSRLISQGCQRAYQVSDLSSLRQPAESQMTFRSACLQRNNGVDECSVPDTLLAVPKAMRQTSCYTTPSQQRTMRSMSQPIDGGDAN